MRTLFYLIYYPILVIYTIYASIYSFFYPNEGRVNVYLSVFLGIVGTVILLRNLYEKYFGVVKLKEYTPEELKEAIIEYLKEHETAWTGEIAEDLRADLLEVVDMLSILEKEGVIS